jgi:hypothetical protein
MKHNGGRKQSKRKIPAAATSWQLAAFRGNNNRRQASYNKNYLLSPLLAGAKIKRTNVTLYLYIWLLKKLAADVSVFPHLLRALAYVSLRTMTTHKEKRSTAKQRCQQRQLKRTRTTNEKKETNSTLTN